MSTKYSKYTKPIKVLLVEDEPHAQKELKRLLTNSGFTIEVLECIDNIADACEWINNNVAVDLMFFDIQLSDGLSFEIFKHIETKTPVIFTTAFDEYAIRAFKVHSIDYLLKPVKQDDLNAAIEKFLSFTHSKEESGFNISQIEKLLEINQTRYKSRFISRIGDQIKHIEVAEIAYFKAEDNEVLLVTKNDKQYFVDYALEQLMSMLDPAIFFRANRSFIVGISSIKKISKYFNSRIHLDLEPATKEMILISRLKVPDFLSWIDK